MMCRALSTLFSVEKENLASTSVETFPGTIFRISVPNCTRRLSNVASTCSFKSFPCFLPYSTAASMSLAYSGFLDAARINDGLVVASCGLYLAIDAKSPESLTTTCRRAVSHQYFEIFDSASRMRVDSHTVPVALSWSREVDIVIVMFR